MECAPVKRSILDIANIGASIRVTQGRALKTHRLHIEEPTLVAVWRGQKCLRWAGRELIVHTGEVVALASEQTFDVINIPCSTTGTFEADALVCADQVVESFLTCRPKGRRIQDVQLIQPACDGLLNSFRHAYTSFYAKDQLPEAVIRSRLEEMLTWLDHHGGYFGSSTSNQVTLRVRQLISSNPGKMWTAPMVARQLAMSEATFRRRLGAENNHFQQLLFDVRMTRALTLLQVTDLSVASIAYEVGYSCSSRFSFRFRQRFGRSPSDIRLSDAVEHLI
ncbi:helix-turn-helix domain-containing protein [Pseudomonas monteilii]|uniref:helix-turn-helix domain-containing protein n=1 Tax=Pseudomonas monteilii TaxID=76759 RepID=UPI003D014236